MSSYYTSAQLEAMRVAKLKKDLENSILQVKEQLQEEHANSVQLTRSDNIIITVTADDSGASGYSVSKMNSIDIQKHTISSSGRRKVEDFSSLLEIGNQKKTKLESILNDEIAKIGERTLLTEDDYDAFRRVQSETERIRNNKEMNIEDRIGLIRMHVQSFLQGARPLSEVDKKMLESDYYRYCAMCKLAGEEAIEKAPYRIESEIRRLSALLEKREQEEYISAALQEIMTELGCTLKDNVVMDHVEGQLFKLEGQPLCDVFVGIDGSGIMFEPIAETRTGSTDKIRHIESSANKICSMYEKVEELAAKKGIILRRVYLEPASIESICTQSDVSESNKKKKAQRRTHAKKDKHMTLEE